ncbi:MAG: KTSC domain-containing protein [Leptolyngbyaceae cyanobacterium MO_188.B28]|nr:KTSC domain-containing protein [Leptolyngbyaceae cyanobacterium MO_188.B28]
MHYSKIDLSKIVAVGHNDEYLEVLLDQGDSIECVEIPAPIEAYEGLQDLNDIIAEETLSLSATLAPASLPSARTPFVVKAVDSSLANSIGYDPEHNVLQLEFNNGAVYQYEDVNEETWEALQSSYSVGKFYNREIKGSYRSHRCD